jgi:hypothetical protein
MVAGIHLKSGDVVLEGLIEGKQEFMNDRMYYYPNIFRLSPNYHIKTNPHR